MTGRIRPGDPLTDRELQILRLLATGAGAAEIARTLYMGLGTVKTDTSRLYGRLGARNAAHAVAIGYAQGLLVPADARAWREATS